MLNYIQHNVHNDSSDQITSGELHFNDVSYAVGFQHPPYFTKLFTQYKKMTPSEYRKGFLQ